MSTRPATTRQVNYIRDLLDQRIIPDDARERATSKLDVGITMDDAGKWIPWLLKQPRRDAQDPADSCVPQYTSERWGVQYEEVMTDDMKLRKIGKLVRADQVIPAGSYAIETPEDPVNNIKFYRLWIGTRFGWKLYIVAGPEEHEASSNWSREVLNKIAQDPGAAARRYGLAIGKCGICGRRLSRQESRERGIGTICAEKWGW